MRRHLGLFDHMSFLEVSLLLLIIVIVIWASLRYKKENYISIYSVNDENVAMELTQLLQENNIESFSFNNLPDPLVPVHTNVEISIILKNALDSEKAMKLINQYFEHLKEAKNWICPKCHEEIEGTLMTCWNCLYEQKKR